MYGTWAARACGVTAVNNVSGLGTAFIRQGLVPTVVRALYRLSQADLRRMALFGMEPGPITVTDDGVRVALVVKRP